jgi:type I restriction enzyme S subunit
VKLGNEKFHATEHAVVVTPEKGIAKDWLFYLLNFLNLNQFATGQAQPGLSVDVLEKVPTAVPIQEIEQQRIADCLTSLDDLIAAQADRIESLKTHKKGLMQRLFPSPETVEA